MNRRSLLPLTLSLTVGLWSGGLLPGARLSAQPGADQPGAGQPGAGQPGAGQPGAPESIELDLDAAVRLALDRNPALAAIEERRREVEAGIREAEGDAWPQLAFVSSWSRSRNPSLLNSPDFSSFLDLFPGGRFIPGEQELYNLGVELRQPVFTSGKTRAAVELARVVAEVNEAQIETARLDTAFAAAQACYGVLAARRSLATVEIQRRGREEALAVVEARYEIGEATRLALLRSQASLAEIDPLLAAARGAVEVAEQRLRVILALPPGTRLVFEDVAATPAPAPAREEMLERALARRPELADLDLQMEALEHQRALSRADGRPQVDLVGHYGHTARLPENLDESLFQDWAVALGVRWELFDGGKRKNHIAQLDSQERQLLLRRQDLVNRIILDLEQATTAYETARGRHRAAELAAEATREATRVAAESYQEGAALQADLLDAQQREILAELAVISAYYDIWTEAARMDRALGLLPGGRAPGEDGTP